jgi:hypothetical protein
MAQFVFWLVWLWLHPFNQFPFFQHLLFWLLTIISDINYHINYYNVSSRQFRCCYNGRTNKFNSSKHIIHLNLLWTIYCSMISVGTYYIRVSNKYSNQFYMCFCIYYNFYKLDCGGWYYWYLSFMVMTGFKSKTCFTTWFIHNHGSQKERLTKKKPQRIFLNIHSI